MDRSDCKARQASTSSLISLHSRRFGFPSLRTTLGEEYQQQNTLDLGMNYFMQNRQIPVLRYENDVHKSYKEFYPLFLRTGAGWGTMTSKPAVQHMDWDEIIRFKVTMYWTGTHVLKVCQNECYPKCNEFSGYQALGPMAGWDPRNLKGIKDGRESILRKRAAMIAKESHLKKMFSFRIEIRIEGFSDMEDAFQKIRDSTLLDFSSWTGNPGDDIQGLDDFQLVLGSITIDDVTILIADER